MEELAHRITSNAGLDRLVVDRTGLAGTYEIKLRYTRPWQRAGADPDLQEISVFAAVQEQLGLRLERQTAMVEMLIVDHIERSPSDN
jgi:uncharacterized protein (TIGR03435 family)